MDKFGKIAIEYKYDGLRAEIHKKEDRIWIFTRRLEDVSHQFPDLVDMARKVLKPRECVVEGEVLAIDPKTGYPQPFQNLSQRIHRKYNIKEMTEKIPIQMNLFDIMYLEGKALFDKPFKERRKILEKNVKPIPKKFQLAKQIVTDDLKKAEKFYKQSLEARQEGVFLKVLDSNYVFGRHVDGWYKIKPIMETLDLVIVAATWGEGKRSKWLSSYVLACRESDIGKFLPCGMMGTGLTEEMFQTMTETLKPLVTEEKGKEVKIKPKIVVEVAYQEIQKSPTYEAGYALRFPRLLRIREDRDPEEAETIDRLAKLYKSQGREG
jgi:DNA ligase-1